MFKIGIRMCVALQYRYQVSAQNTAQQCQVFSQQKNTPAITLSNVALWINEQGKSVILTDHITTHDMTPSKLQNRMSMEFTAPACTLQT
jgi:hypothetical protein